MRIRACRTERKPGSGQGWALCVDEELGVIRGRACAAFVFPVLFAASLKALSLAPGFCLGTPGRVHYIRVLVVPAVTAPTLRISVP